MIKENKEERARVGVEYGIPNPTRAEEARKPAVVLRS